MRVKKVANALEEKGTQHGTFWWMLRLKRYQCITVMKPPLEKDEYFGGNGGRNRSTAKHKSDD